MKLSKIKRVIPWWLRIVMKIIISRLPLVGSYAFWQSFGLFRHGSMDNIYYSYRVFSEHMEKTKVHPLKGKVLVEIGPGDGLSTAVIAASFGASSVLIDEGNFVAKDTNYLVTLCDFLQKKGLSPPNISSTDNISEILLKCKSKYLTNGVQSFSKISDDSIDIIFSQAVLEHVSRQDFFKLAEECYRVCKSKAICSHQVDLRDHLGGGLNNLRFSNKVWESDFFKKSGFYTNRIQYDEILKIFKKAGFSCNEYAVNRWDNLPLSKNKLSNEFKHLSLENLKVKSFDVILKK